MSVIKLKELLLKNFKGITNLVIEFETLTNIYGENKLGKTTIFDGFTWLLFDKDSKDRSKFDVQPLDERNNVVHMLETEVQGIIEVDGKNMELKKILKEKWVKKRGEVNSELKGTETLYYVNEVPVKLSEYKEKINSIIDEKLFKLISSPYYFSLNMKLEDRRKVILDIIGDITLESVVNYNSSLEPLIKLLNDTDLDTFKRTIAARIKKFNEDKKSIPDRIDELNNSINSELDFDALAFRKRGIVAGIANVEEKLADGSKLSETSLKDKNRLYEIKSKLRDLEYKADEEAKWLLKQLNCDLREIENSILKNENSRDRINTSIKNKETKGLALESEIKTLRNQWGIVYEEELQMSEEEFLCPTCRRHFEEKDIEIKREEMITNFNNNKNKKLEDINNLGKNKKEFKEKLEDEIIAAKGELDTFIDKFNELVIAKEEKEKAINNFNATVEFVVSEEYKELKAQEIKLENEINDSENAAKLGPINQIQIELKATRKELESQLEEVNNKLGFKEQNIKTKARITELMVEEKRLADKIAELEGQEFLCEKYIKTKVELLETGINNKFKFVKFKLFNTLVNGGVEERCEALIDGVPFSNANTASQLNAGIDIINALSEHYKISAPVFIDNRESVNEILECNSQIINLIVSKDKKLVIENIESEVA